MPYSYVYTMNYNLLTEKIQWLEYHMKNKLSMKLIGGRKMKSVKYLFPPTTTKVNRNTVLEVNDKIQQNTEQNIRNFSGKSKEEITNRMNKLNYEWDTERVLELNLAMIVFLTSILGLFGKKRWLVLTCIVSLL